MITARIPLSTPDVARHYDELDEFYRDVWGDHVHHGLWEDEKDDRCVEDATLRLLQRATHTLGLSPGSRLVDIGCGYGASSRWLAEHQAVKVTALTLSECQATHARLASPPSRGSVEYRVEDWLENTFPDGSFEAAMAIESLAHMTDKHRFFHQLHRTLRPGGRAALAVWTVADDLNWFETLLLRKICEEGRLPGMGTLREYGQMARDHGFTITESVDLTSRVERTWWIIARRVLFGLFTRPRYLRFILARAFREPIFALALPRLLFAYRTGAIRYALLALIKPATN